MIEDFDEEQDEPQDGWGKVVALLLLVTVIGSFVGWLIGKICTNG